MLWIKRIGVFCLEKGEMKIIENKIILLVCSVEA